MRRRDHLTVGQRLFNFAAAVSLLSCAAIAYLWISTWGDVQLSKQIGPLHVLLVNGEAELAWGRYWGTLSDVETGSLPSIANACPHRLMGFGADAGPPLRCVVPHWSVALATMVFPIVWLVNHRRRASALGTGVCPSCGYAPRATPERCPECGPLPEPPHKPPMRRTGRGTS